MAVIDSDNLLSKMLSFFFFFLKKESSIHNKGVSNIIITMGS